MPENVSELFSAPTGDVYLVAKLVGVPLYSSYKLKVNYLNAMAKTGKTSPIISKLMDLVQRGVLLPVYSTDKLLKSIRKKQPIEVQGFAGLVSQDKKIFIFVETETNFFSFTSNDALATVTIHELIHYVASYHLNDFYNIFKDNLEEFYGMYFTKYLSCNPKDIDSSKLTELVSFINFNLEPFAFQLSNSTLKKYFVKIAKTFSESTTLDETEFDRKITSLIVLIKILQKLVISGQPQLFTQIVMRHKEVVSPLYVSYKYMMGVDPMSAKNLCFQELFSTSEVIAIPAMVKSLDPKVYKAINKL